MKNKRKNQLPKVKDGDILFEREEPPEIPGRKACIADRRGRARKGDTHNCKWLSAMQDELDSLHENHTYELVELPKGKRHSRTNGCTS